MSRRYARIQVEELGARLLPSATIAVVSDIPLTSAAAAGPSPVEDDQGNGALPRFGSEAAFRQFVIERAVQQYSYYFGRSVLYYPWDDRVYLSSATAGLEDSVTASYSNTNTQVAGVDEGDMVETDGQYLYVLRDYQLVILDALPADELKTLSVTPLHGYLQGQYLNGNRLTVIAQEYTQQYNLHTFAADDVAAFRLWPGWRSDPFVTVSTFDVSDRAAPKLVQKTTLDGYYRDSRAIGDTVYVALDNYQLNLPEPAYTIENAPLGEANRQHQVYESEASYRARLASLPLDSLLPRYTTQGTSANAAGVLTDARDIYKPRQPDDTNLTSLVAIGVGADNAGAIEAVTQLSAYGGTLYASQDNFYMITSRWSENSVVSTIDKFSLRGGHIRLAASGSVPGTVLNQFSIDEHGRYLRIATTTGWGQEASNNVYVLAEHGKSLDVVGRLEDFAPGESIYSVRFLGDRGYITTFRRIDPLFTIDLSDPKNPLLAGELEVTGYNSYLQVINERYVLGIGQEQDPVTGRVEDPQISIYDVSDLEHPTLVSRYVVSTDGWWWSPSTYDHHAINYYPELGLLTLPISIYDKSWRGHSAQLVFDVDADKGTLRAKGQISDETTIERGVFIGNMLYSISHSSVQVHDVSDLETPVAQVSLPDNGLRYLDQIVCIFVVDVQTPTKEEAQPDDTVDAEQDGGEVVRVSVTQTAGPEPTPAPEPTPEPKPPTDQAGTERTAPPGSATDTATTFARVVVSGPAGAAFLMPPVVAAPPAASSGVDFANPATVPVGLASMPTVFLSGGSDIEAGNSDDTEVDLESPQTPGEEEQLQEMLDDVAWSGWRVDMLPASPPTDGIVMTVDVAPLLLSLGRRAEALPMPCENAFDELGKQDESSPWLVAAATIVMAPSLVAPRAERARHKLEHA